MGDFNGDSDLDLAVANDSVSIRPNGTVSILLGTGGTSVPTFGSPTNYTTGDVPRAVATANFDGDSDLDLVVANQGSNSNSVRVLLGAGNGTFAVSTNLGACATPNSLAISDLNGDSDPDIVAVNEDCNNISVWLGGAGRASARGPTSRLASFPDELDAGDLNGDGLADLVVANQASDDLTVLLGLGTGSRARAHLPWRRRPLGGGDRSVQWRLAHGYRPRTRSPTTWESTSGSRRDMRVPRVQPRSTSASCRRSWSAAAGTPATGYSARDLGVQPARGGPSYLTLNAPERTAPFPWAGRFDGLPDDEDLLHGCFDVSVLRTRRADRRQDRFDDHRRALHGHERRLLGGRRHVLRKLLLKTILRLTDRRNAPAQEVGRRWIRRSRLACSSASGACSVSTSADAVIPNIAFEGTRAIWGLSKIEVWDGGSDGNLAAAPAPASGVCPPACIGNGGETLFMHQGFFVP